MLMSTFASPGTSSTPLESLRNWKATPSVVLACASTIGDVVSCRMASPEFARSDGNTNTVLQRAGSFARGGTLAPASLSLCEREPSKSHARCKGESVPKTLNSNDLLVFRPQERADLPHCQAGENRAGYEADSVNARGVEKRVRIQKKT